MDIPTLLSEIEGIANCEIRPPAGLPVVAPPYVLPDDLIAFYRLCGGLRLFTEAPFCLEIVPPDRMLVANPVILAGASTDDLEASKDHASWSWYIIGEGENSQFITIDLSLKHLGRCYDSFWDRHPGNSEVIAFSFTSFLTQIVAAQGEDWYWHLPDFAPLGYPFEPISDTN